MTDIAGIGPGLFSEGSDKTDEAKLILIADDDAGTRLLLRNKIEKAGYAVIAAKNGQEAISRLSDRVTGAVLDLMMPDIDGLECLRYIRQHYPDLSPIMLTASENISNAVEAMKQGALDYVIKPVNPRQLIALIEKSVAAFEQSRRLKAAEQKLEDTRRHQLYVAAQIQQTLLLGHPPTDMSGLEIAHLTLASQQIDGDFYDFIRQSPQVLDLVVADVMGKGIMAAFMGAALKSAFLRVVNDLNHPGALPEPEQIVTAVHDYMIRQMEQFETFVTFCYGRFDLDNCRFCYVDCGHVRTIHYQGATRSVRLLQGVNMPLGFPEPEGFSQFSISFTPGDLFLFYSDGVTEAASPEGERYDEFRLVRHVERHGDKPPGELVRGIRQEVIDFTGTDVFTDDFTCVAVRIAGAAIEEAACGSEELHIESDLKELKNVRDFVRRFCCRAGKRRLDSTRIDEIELAANEVVTNIIKHAYRGAPNQPIDIHASAFSRHIELEFRDRGAPFDPADVPPPVLDGTRENGMGCYIIRHSVDEVHYGRNETEGKNCARLKIVLSPSANDA